MYLDWAILLFTLYYTFRRINMLEKLREKWDEILNYMKEEHDISSVSFRTWLLPLELYSFENNTLYILVPDDQNFRQYLEKKYLFLLQISIEEITGIECGIEFLLKGSVKKENHPTRKSRRKAAVPM